MPRPSYKHYPVCRTCLNVIRTRSFRLGENSGCGEGLKISHVLRYIVPEVYLGLSNNPEICGNCREGLRVAYTFRKLCLETETMIGNYLKNVRCTAQAIDLGAVIHFLSTMKDKQEPIITPIDPKFSENAVPSTSKSDDVAENNDDLHKKTSFTVENMTQQEGKPVKTIKRQVTSEAKFIPNKIVTEDLIFDSKLGLHRNKDGKYFRISPNGTIIEVVLKPITEKNTTFERNTKLKDLLSKEPKFELDLTKNSYAKPVTEQPSRIICEETGLFKNNNNEYFDVDGTSIPKEQVDAEKAKAVQKADRLCEISNIYTVSEDEEDTKSHQTNEAKKDGDSSVRTYTKKSTTDSVLIRKKELTKIAAQLYECEESDSFQVNREAVEKTKTYENKSVTEYTNNTTNNNQPTTGRSMIKVRRFEDLVDPASTSNYRPILPKLVPLETVLTPIQAKSTEEKAEANILNFVINRDLLLGLQNETNSNVRGTSMNSSSNQLNELPAASIKTLQNQPLNAHKENLPNLCETDPLAIDIKEEPLDLEFDNNSVSDETLSAAEPTDLDQLPSIINMDNYVDIPDFVQIQNFSGKKDLSFLGAQTVEKKAESSNDVQTLKPKSQKIHSSEYTLWNTLPDKFEYNGKTLIKYDNYYMIDPSEKSPSGSTSKKRRRRNLKIIAVDEDKRVFSNYNYNEDGLYVNDHDYLVAPYVKNKMLVLDQQTLSCICYICDNVQNTEYHVDHMKSHISTCQVCGINYNTPYVLNMHMKLKHTSNCSICNKAVLNRKMSQHKKMHQKGSGLLVFNTQKQEQNKTEEIQEDFEYNNVEVSNLPGKRQLLSALSFKRCFVPLCNNTSNNSQKIFFTVPRVKAEQWFKAVKFPGKPSPNIRYQCCEDHFDMKKDCANWNAFKKGANKRIFMSRFAIPHKYVFEKSSVPSSFSQFYDEVEEKDSDHNSDKEDSESEKADSDSSVQFVVRKKPTLGQLEQINSNKCSKRKTRNRYITPKSEPETDDEHIEKKFKKIVRKEEDAVNFNPNKNVKNENQLSVGLKENTSQIQKLPAEQSTKVLYVKVKKELFSKNSCDIPEESLQHTLDESTKNLTDNSFQDLANESSYELASQSSVKEEYDKSEISLSNVITTKRLRKTVETPSGVVEQRRTRTNTGNVSEMSVDITQINAENCKKYYYRMKKITNAEKCRRYRQRKKLLAQQTQSKNEVIHTSSTSSLQMTFEPQLITTVFKGPLTNAENCKNYRKRQKAASLQIKKAPKTSAERARTYRLRQKQLAEASKLSSNEVLYSQSTLNSQMMLEPPPQPVTLKIKKTPKTSAERARMYRLRQKQLAEESKFSANEVLYTPSTSNLQMMLEPSPQPFTTGRGNSKAAQRMRLYRQRLREKNTDASRSPEIRQRPLTGAERSRLWYQRKKLKEMNLLNPNQQSSESQDSESVIQINDLHNTENTAATTSAESSVLNLHGVTRLHQTENLDSAINLPGSLQKPLTGAERSKLWYQRKKLKEMNSLNPNQQSSESQESESIIQINDLRNTENTAATTT